MTTTYTGPTPWDALIAEAKAHRQWAIANVLKSAEEGYRRAKAEDATLLEAAKNALQVIEDVYGISLEGEDDTDEPQHSTQLMLRAAIAQHEGREH